MTRRTRCNSIWKKIIILDDKGIESRSFELNDLGQLKDKIKTQKRRKIHECSRTRKIKDQTKTSIPKEASETNSNLNPNPNSNLNIQSQPFEIDVFQDQNDSLFEFFQEFSDNKNEYNLFDEYNNFFTMNENLNSHEFNEDDFLYPSF